MNQVMAQWEDEECNRQVQFSVGYKIENGNVEIVTVTPNKVSFICQESNTITRTMSIHTENGRRMLADQIVAAGQIERLKGEIADRNHELVTA